MKEHPVKAFPTIGCCGIDCGLCPRYYTAGTSRCPGCAGPGFFEKHPSCGCITCCVKKRRLEVCSQCDEFPCPKFAPRPDGDSFVTHRKALINLNSIRGEGLERFLEQQRKRIGWMETALAEFDDGRMKSFYCLAAALLPAADLEESLRRARKHLSQDRAGALDAKSRAGILRGYLDDCAAESGVELKLRRKPK